MKIYKNQFVFVIMVLSVASLFASNATGKTNVSQNIVPNINSDEDIFALAVENYMNNNFSIAVEKFLELKSNGYDNFEVNFNIGACYFKLNRYGESRFYFERALFFKPFDEDLFFNLRVLYKTILESPKTAEQDIMNKRLLFFFPSLYILIFFCIMFMSGVFSLILLVKFPKAKKIFLVLMSSFFTVAIILSSIFYLQYREYNSKIFIVKEKSADVYLTPNDEKSLLLTIPEGAKGKIIEDIGTFIKMRMPDGSTGWINKTFIVTKNN